MAAEPDFLLNIGININNMIAGFAGGVVNAFVFKRVDPWSIVGSVVVGALTANYLTDAARSYMGTSAPATGFIVGLGGMAICQGLVEALKRWRPSLASVLQNEKEKP